MRSPGASFDSSVSFCEYTRRRPFASVIQIEPASASVNERASRSVWSITSARSCARPSLVPSAATSAMRSRWSWLSWPSSSFIADRRRFAESTSAFRRTSSAWLWASARIARSRSRCARPMRAW